MSSTHQSYMGDGYYVTIQHCEKKGCDVYLGVNYPSSFCTDHKPQPINPKSKGKLS